MQLKTILNQDNLAMIFIPSHISFYTTRHTELHAQACGLLQQRHNLSMLRPVNGYKPSAWPLKTAHRLKSAKIRWSFGPSMTDIDDKH